MRNTLCWWFGCEPDPRDPAPPGYLECRRCGEFVEYSDLVGDTRRARFKRWISYWLFRKWWPRQCPFCRRRFSCDESVDHIPF